MWIETIRDSDALAGMWLAWERLRCEAQWPGLFAIPAGFSWWLRYGPAGGQPWLLARWQGRRLTGLLPLLRPQHDDGPGCTLRLPPLVRAPLGDQPTVFLLEVFQSWDRLGGRASGICGCWAPPEDRPPGRWAVAARWRRWDFQPAGAAWQVLVPDRNRGPDAIRAGIPARRLLHLSGAAKDWEAADWLGWHPRMTRDPQAWWQLAELLDRHGRLLLVRLESGAQWAGLLLAAREPWGTVLLARGVWHGEHRLPELLGDCRWGERLPWFVPAAWFSSWEEGMPRGCLSRWRFVSPRADRRSWRRWLPRISGRSDKKRRFVSEPAW